MTSSHGQEQFSFIEDPDEANSSLLAEDPSVYPDETTELDDEDEDFIPRPPLRPTKLSIALVGLVVVGIGFLGGAFAQKHYGTTSASSASARGNFNRGGAGGAEGFGAGGFGSGEGLGAGGFGNAGTASDTSGSTGQSSTQSPTIPAVVGTISSVKGSTVVVKNLGGKRVTVTVTKQTTLTAKYGSSALKVGTSVAVVGSTTSSGTVTATTITAQ
jgi:hypothetical protein